MIRKTLIKSLAFINRTQVIIINALGELQWANRSFNDLTGESLESFKTKFGNTIYEVSNNSNIKTIGLHK